MKQSPHHPLAAGVFPRLPWPVFWQTDRDTWRPIGLLMDFLSGFGAIWSEVGSYQSSCTIKNVSIRLRIHDPFVMKTARNETFLHVWCCNLIPRLHRPYKVYIFWFSFLKWMQDALSFKEIYTLLGLSWLFIKWHHRNRINVTFQVVFWLKGSCILKEKGTKLKRLPFGRGLNIIVFFGLIRFIPDKWILDFRIQTQPIWDFFQRISTL